MYEQEIPYEIGCQLEALDSVLNGGNKVNPKLALWVPDENGAEDRLAVVAHIVAQDKYLEVYRVPKEVSDFLVANNEIAPASEATEWDFGKWSGLGEQLSVPLEAFEKRELEELHDFHMAQI